MSKLIWAGELYQHYKGSFYEIVCIAQHTEEQCPMVIYKLHKGPEQVWARPLDMFQEMVEVDGKTIPRFSKIT